MLKFKRILLIGLLVMLVATGCGTKDLTKGKSAQEIIEGTYEKMAQVQNYDMNLQMQMKMETPEGKLDMTLDGKATIFQKPMLMKMVLQTKDPESGESVAIEQYMEQTEKGLNVYQKVEEQWIKMSMNDPSLAEMMNMDPANNMKIFLENLKEAKILNQEEKVGEKDTVKIEMAASSEIYEDLMKQMPGMNFSQANMPFGPEFLSKMGDIKYVLWIDKLTLETVKTSMDLTENIQNLGKALVDSGTVPKELAGIFAGMEMSASYEIYNLDTAEKFEIPEEAKNGQEIPVPGVN
ncbi:MAG: DUF6612 family protein [Bacillota bacterium]